MSQFLPGEDVVVEFAGGIFPAEVLKVEASGFVLCKAHLDMSWDYGLASSRLDPEQTIAVRQGHVRRVDA